MTKRFEVYKCKLCGNIIEVLHGAAGDMQCCGNAMVAMVENTVEAAVEKHIPVITKVEGGYLVKVGSVDHPMTEEHYIEWIEILTGDSVCRKYLKSTGEPQASFTTQSEPSEARAYCNLHGLWKS